MDRDQSGIFDEVVELGGPAGLDRLEQVPARRGVLAIFAANDQPVLLLTAADLRARLKARMRQAEDDQPRRRMVDLASVAAKVGWKLALSPFQADLTYLQLARHFWPDSYEDLLAWRAPRMVHCDLSAEFPRLARADDFAAPGVYLGPFASAASADRFIEVLVDGFDLCRNHRILLRAPHGQPCVYGELGRSLRACDGTISMDQYRQAMREAVAYGCGRRAEHRRRLAEQMKRAAGAMQYEQAAAIRGRLERLGELDSPALAHVGPMEELAHILVQGTGRKTRLLSFTATWHDCQPGPDLKPGKLDAQWPPLLAQMQQQAVAARQARPDRWLVGLISHYLYSSAAKAGLLVRWRGGLDGAELAERIEQSAGQLGIAPGPKAS